MGSGASEGHGQAVNLRGMTKSLHAKDAKTENRCEVEGCSRVSDSANFVWPRRMEAGDVLDTLRAHRAVICAFSFEFVSR
jgi:hypothetical protein